MELTDNSQITYGQWLKALDDGRIEGYAVVFGTKDQVGQRFTKDTDFGDLSNPANVRMYYHHALDNRLGHTLIGVWEAIKIDDVGVWVRGKLDMANQYVKRLYQMIQEGGKMGLSSGAVPQRVEIDEDTGTIKRWVINEISPTPTPAEPTTIRLLSAVKADVNPVSLLEREGVLNAPIDANASDVQDAPPNTAVTPVGLPMAQPSAVAKATQPNVKSTNKELKAMDFKQEMIRLITEAGFNAPTDEQLEAFMAQIAPAEKAIDAMPVDEKAEFVKTVAKAFIDTMAAMKAETEKAERAALATKAAQAMAAAAMKAVPVSSVPPAGYDTKPSGGGRLSIKSHWDNLTLPQLLGVATLGESKRINPSGDLLTREYYGALAHKLAQATQNDPQNDITEGTRRFAIKANELDHTTNAGFGQEWVWQAWSDVLWQRARLDTLVQSVCKVEGMDAKQKYLTIEGDDAEMYYVGESTDSSQIGIIGSAGPVLPSKFGTKRLLLEAEKLAILITYSEELREDSIINMATHVSTSAEKAFRNGLENGMMNGDTATAANTNINIVDGTPVTTPNQRKTYLAYDGMIKHGLANGLDCAGALSLSKLRDTRKKLAPEYNTKPEELVWIVDPYVYQEIIKLPEVVTVDKYGPMATVLTGEIGKIDGIRIIVSGQMGLANATGRINSVNPSTNNVKGRAVLAVRDRWVLAYRRDMRVNFTHIPYSDAHIFSLFARIDFVAGFPNVASTLFNITV